MPFGHTSTTKCYVFTSVAATLHTALFTNCCSMQQPFSCCTFAEQPNGLDAATTVALLSVSVLETSTIRGLQVHRGQHQHQHLQQQLRRQQLQHQHQELRVPPASEQNLPAQGWNH